MSTSIELNDEQTKRLQALAEELGIAPQDLAHAAINDLLAQSASDFETAAKKVLNKNQELYRRLS